MSLDRALQELYQEKEILDKAILYMEQLEHSVNNPMLPLRDKRGRKSVPEGERKEISERMKRYWASKKQ